MSNAPSAVTDETLARFPSFTSLRDRHLELLQRRREAGETREFWLEVDDFIRRGQTTGALLDSDQDREAGQSLLDYWSNALYRAGLEPPDATLAEFDPTLAPELPETPCPYLGLDAFREADRAHFFGRQRLVESMVAHLSSSRLLAVVGPSGSGKSSAVLAGLLPALKAGQIPGSERWRYAPPIVPGSNPLANLARLFRPSGVDAAGWIAGQIECFRQGTSYLTQMVRSSPVPIVLVVDQFEEVFTLCDDDATRQAFVGNLVDLIRSPGVRHSLILSMRIDFESNVARLPTFQPLFEKAEVRVLPLGAGELREAIEEPAKAVGLKFEAGVVDALVKDILGEPAALPLLQFTLLKLWDHRERNRVTWEAYQRLGGSRRALARSADEFYDKLLVEEQVTARRILLRMVRPGEGLEVTSNRIRREALYRAGEAAENDRIDRVMDRLIQARLVRLTEGDTPADAQVEVAHEALVRNWPRLVDWLEEDRETLRQRLRLTAAAEQWKAVGKDPEVLWRGALLAQADGYPDLNKLEAEFVQAGQAAAEAERQKEAAQHDKLVRAQARAEAEQEQAKEIAQANRRLRWFLAALVILLILTIGAAVFGLTQRDRAERQSRLSISRGLAAAAMDNLSVDPERSLLLASEAVLETFATDKTTTSEAENALHQVVQASRLQLTLRGYADAIYGVAFSPDGARLATANSNGTTKVWDASSGQMLFTLAGQTGAVRGLAFNPDGTRLATANDDDTVKIWDVAAGHVARTLVGHSGAVNSVTFSPNGTRLATASWDETAKVWDATIGQVALTLAGHTGTVWDVAFSPDGSRLATAGGDGKVIVWDAVSGQQVLTLAGHTDDVLGVAFNGDGTRLATASYDMTMRVWDATSGKGLSILYGHTNTPFDVAFYGTRLATGSADNTVKVWDADSGREVFTLYGHTNVVHGVAFSPDGTRLATASWDGTARVWSLAPSRELFTISSQSRGVQDVAYSPDGTRLATAGSDGTAKVWDVASMHEIVTLTGHAGAVRGVAYSPDGTRLATASLDGTARVWDAASGAELLAFRGHNAIVGNVAFSPDGKRVATAGGDGTVTIWDAASAQELLFLQGYTQAVWDVAFSPDGTRLATARSEGVAEVWDIRDTGSARLLLTLHGHGRRVFGVAFSADGTRLATASEDRTAKIWDAVSGKKLLSLSGHTDSVWDVAFSPDGRQLATGSFDKTVKVWDTASGQELLTLSGHTDRIYAVTLSPDGEHLVSAGADDTIRRFTLNVEELMELACSRATRNLSLDEWRKYLGGDVPYRRTCPALPSGEVINIPTSTP